MRHLLQALANGYTAHWQHNPSARGVSFLVISTDIPVPSEASNIPGAKGIMKGRLEYDAKQGDADARFAGFSAVLTIGYNYRGPGVDISKHRQVWRQHFPCAHVPLEVSQEIENDTQEEAFTQTIQIPMHGVPFEMPPGFQLAPGIEMVDGFPTWVGGADGIEDNPRTGLDGFEVGAVDGLQITGIHLVGWAPGPTPGPGAEP
jgi:hypothetical protein